MGFNQLKMYTFRYIFKKMSSSDNDSSILDSEEDFTIEESEIDTELSSIIKSAKFNNKKAQITGLLFYHNHRFVQLLEGEKAQLEQLMDKLALDKRHKNIERIVDEPLGHRYFDKWHMDSFNINNKEMIDPSALRLFKDMY